MLIRVLLLVALTLPALAWAKSPCDSPLHWGQCKDGERTEEQGEAQARPSVTDAKQAAPDQPNPQGEKHHGFLGPEWSLVWVTIGLCAITGALAVYTAFLYRTTKKLAIDAKETGDRQVAIAESQTRISSSQQEINRLQYLAAHRPRLKVRNVNIMPPSAALIGSTLFFSHGAEIKVALVVVNVGRSPAEIVGTRYRIFASRTGLPSLPPYIGNNFRTNFLKEGEILGEGEPTTATDLIDTLALSGPAPGADLRLREFDEDGWTLYVMGQIRYRTPGSSVTRFMGFCRERTGEGKFRSVDDPDYEHED